MWEKKGLLIEPQNKLWWMQTHAMLPTPVQIGEDKYRIYFSGRDINNTSHVGFADVKIFPHSMQVNNFSKDPVFSPGQRGCFDDNGVTPSCIVGNNFYYIGWNSGTTTTRMSLVMGLADATTFERHSRAPLFIRTDREPFNILTAPFVMKDDELYKMWYVSGEGWRTKDLPIYNIKYATSTDGKNWTRNGHVAIDLFDNETALARPCVVKEGNIYEMFFSYKDPSIGYRIGTAISNDGLSWERQDKKVLDPSSSGWDSKMVEYTYVFRHKNRRYMLYNGNGYGQTGIGYAIEKYNRIAIMQPTYLPWMGYFSMIKNSDMFVFFDDVQVTKRSWQVRNRIKIKDDFTFLTLPIKKNKSSHETKIFEAEISEDVPWRSKHLKSIEHSYRKSPHYEDARGLVRDLLNFEGNNLADFNINFISNVCKGLSIETPLCRSSELPIYGRKDEYLVSICRYFQAKEYLSAPGSKGYIEEGENLFEKSNIDVIYHNYSHPIYTQTNGNFISHLAIIDAIFSIGLEAVKEAI